MAAHLTELKVKGYSCLKDVECALTPLHAFIGPNDSGKSTLLRVIGSLDRMHLMGQVGGIHARFSDGSELKFGYDAPPEYGGTGTTSARLAEGRLGVQLVHLDADALRTPSQLIAYGQPLELVGRGQNLAGLYDALRDRSVDRFAAISKQVKSLFPSVNDLGLRAVGNDRKVLAVTLVDGTPVLSVEMSEGLLYYLAFAILGELKRPLIYLIEEPENGLHPSRIREIVAMLRNITAGPDGVQVLMATHSPLVINELRPEEVTVVTRDPLTGTKLRALKQTPHFEERSKVYALGELWLSYADGTTEAPLFDTEGR
jgi:predicted ATPase